MFFSLLFFLLVTVAASIIGFSFKNGISPTPTSKKVKCALMSSLPDDLSGVILELGSGWGSLAFALAKRYPNCQVIAYETSPVPYLFCLGCQLLRRFPNLLFLRKDFFFSSFDKASLVVCYLYPKAMQKLLLKFKKELKSTALVVTHTFSLMGKKPLLTLHAKDLYCTPIYHYQDFS